MELEVIAKAATLEPEAPKKLANVPETPTSSDDFVYDYGWRAWSCVLASFLLYTLAVGYSFAFGVFQAEYSLVQFPEASDLAISFIGGTNAAALVIAIFFMGRPCEIFGLRTVTVVGGVLMVISLIAASWCNSVPTLIVTQGIIGGVGAGCLFVPAAALPAPYFDKKRALAMGIAASGAGAGGIAWSYIIAGCIAALDYRWALRISAAITALIICVSLVFMRSPPHVTKARKAGSFTERVRLMVKEKWLLCFWLCFMVALFGYATPSYYLSAYVQTEGGASASTGSTILAVFNVGAMIGRVALGYVSDSRLGVFNTFILSLSLAGVFQIAMWLPARGNLPASFVFSFLYGFFGSGAIGTSTAVLARHVDVNLMASISGIFYTSEIPGFLTGAPISGAILGRSGYTAVICYSGGCMLAGSMIGIAAKIMLQRKLKQRFFSTM